MSAEILTKDQLEQIRENSTKAMNISGKVLAVGGYGSAIAYAGPSHLRTPLMIGGAIVALTGLAGIMISSRVPNIAESINNRRILKSIDKGYPELAL